MRDERGQAITEYILLLFFVATAAVAVKKTLSDVRFADLLITRNAFFQEYRNAYKYGHPKAQGVDEGGYQKHPRRGSGSNSSRIFILTQ